MRPLAAFAKCAGQFQSTVSLYKVDNQKFDGKSPLSMMVMGAEQGTELILEIEGPDQEAAMKTLLEVWENLSNLDSETSEISGE